MTNRKLKKILEKHNMSIPTNPKYSIYHPFKTWSKMDRKAKNLFKSLLKSSYQLIISKPLPAAFENTYVTNQSKLNSNNP